VAKTSSRTLAQPPAAGYSATPLAAKLGIKAGSTVHVTGAPAGFERLLEPLPRGVRFASRLAPEVDVAHIFATRKAELRAALASHRRTLAPEATVWVSWPKKASGVPTEVSEDTVRELALPLGFVDVKVCAIDATWSGLKLVVRKALRPGKEPRRD
jgi:hypothetical protein